MNTLEFNNPTENDRKMFFPKTVFEAWIRNHHLANTAYPIAHLQTMMDYRIEDSQKNEFAKQVWDWVDELWLYVHVPFCENRCSFCEYTVIDPTTNQTHEELYFSKLLKEFELYRNNTDLKWKRLIWFDIWWGTPSLPDTRHIENVINAANETFNIPNGVDISIETTPKIAAYDLEKIKRYKQMGINRISMWVQSITASVLENAWRTNTSINWNKEAVENIRTAWFDKLNVDIMYWLVGQTVANLKATIIHILELDPEFITIYRTRYKWTRMANQAENVTREEINEQQFAIKDILDNAWYEWAIWKNTFSKIKGNLGTSDYLTKRVVSWAEYLGVWLGSQSFNIKSLSYNSWAANKRMDDYYRDIDAWVLPIQDIYHLPKVASIGKFISVSFYFGWINLASFEKNYWDKIEKFFPLEIEFVLENGYMKMEWDNLRITEKWLLNFNWVISLFYSPAIKGYLINK